MNTAYVSKARIVDELGEISQYKKILDNDVYQSNEPHWRSLKKNTITLFQVLIDQDLKELVKVLNHYPQYIEWVCEHFRYAYSYSENIADIDAASQLLFLGEAYFSKQFVRNVMRKLPKTDEMSLEELSSFVDFIQTSHIQWHPIITNFFCENLLKTVAKSHMHPLQRVVISKPIANIQHQETYDYDAQDRDAMLDIPYMN